MKKKLKKYRINADLSKVVAVSIVDNPATESEFLVLSEEKPELFVAQNDDKRMIYGCALRADFPIYRKNSEMGEYLLEFDADAIDKISKDFFKNGFQKNWTEAHESELDGLTITESWIKTDDYKDKSVALGLDSSIPVGSWFIGAYCENDEIYEKCKNGLYHGFSVESFVSLEEFESQSEPVAGHEVEDAAPELPFRQFVDEIKTMIKDAFPKATETRNDVKEEQAVVETTEEAAESAEEKPQEATISDEVEEQSTEEKIEPQNASNEDKHLEELIKNLRAEIDALKNLNEGLQQKVKGLESQPSAKPVKTAAGKGNNGDTYANWRETMKNLINR